ncbi:hypothetical protein Ahy_A01g002244 [Arachis hypogaea]|uniref:Photosystem I assembly protein Ycf4 n=1 Tax=Arachis hypogaea TaxID=3818 RepID=A0A445EQD1_ARAHY|nr:hypothetical protein Ahy_A01g002244 [Arachis hypogaea]
MNLKEIVLRSNLYGTRDASICINGPGYVTAQDIILPPSVEIVDNTQHIANLIEPINLCIRLEIERNRGYCIKRLKNFQDGSYPIDAVFMPVRNANHSIHSYVNGNEKQEILFLEIWTNGSLTPKEALYEASHIQSIRIEVKEGISTRRILYMEIIGQGAIPLTRIDENLTSREIEQKAAELAYFLRVPIELL